MKHITNLILAIALSTLLSCTQKPNVPKDMFIIKGYLTNVPDGSVIDLRCSDGKISTPFAIDTIVNGQFEFCDSILPENYFLTIGSPSDGFSKTLLKLWVESQTYIEVKGDGSLIIDWSIKSDIPCQKEEAEYLKAGFPEALEYAKISVEKNKYRQEAIETMLETGVFSYGDNRQKVDSLDKLTSPIWDKITIKRLKYLKTAPITEHWMTKYSHHAQSFYYNKNRLDETARIIEELYQRLSPKQLESEVGEFITSCIYPPTIVEEGDDMVDGELYDIDGNLQTLSQFKGKYILLDFWSSGCGPCIAAIPEMELMANRYENLAVVSINLDNKPRWEEAIQRYNLTGIQLNELSLKSTLYNSYCAEKSIPYYVIISPEGKVIKKWSGYAKWSIKRELKAVIDN